MYNLQLKSRVKVTRSLYRSCFTRDSSFSRSCTHDHSIYNK